MQLQITRCYVLAIPVCTLCSNRSMHMWHHRPAAILRHYFAASALHGQACIPYQHQALYAAACKPQQLYSCLLPPRMLLPALQIAMQIAIFTIAWGNTACLLACIAEHIFKNCSCWRSGDNVTVAWVYGLPCWSQMLMAVPVPLTAELVLRFPQGPSWQAPLQQA